MKLGDIVIFGSLSPGELGTSQKDVPAIVTRVWTPDSVDLLVFRDLQSPMPVGSVARKGTVQSPPRWFTDKA